MLSLLADENFNNDIVRGLWLRMPDLDLVRAQDAGLTGCTDRKILSWAAEAHRIILTHDRATMPAWAFQRLLEGESMPGVWIIACCV